VSGQYFLHAPQNPAAIVKSPFVVNVFWGGFWNSEQGNARREAIDSAWTTLGGDPAFWNIAKEYGVGMGAFAGSWVIHPEFVEGSGTPCTAPNPPPKDIGPGQYGCSAAEWCEFRGRACAQVIPNDAQTAAHDIQQAIAAGQLPTNGPGVIYAIYLPPNTVAANDYPGGDGGYHGAFNDASGTVYRFAYMDNRSYDTDETQIAVGTHEVYETATDALGYEGWYLWNATSPRELADRCGFAWQDLPILDGHHINGIWSRTLCRCNPSR
jgi:hypothetical protein